MTDTRGGGAGLSLDDFICFMRSRGAGELTHDQLMDRAARLGLSDELLAAHGRFAKDDYARNLVCRTREFELLVLCWRPGQHSTIHDHNGSLNAIKVYRGELTSRLYVPAQGSPPQAVGPVRQIEEQHISPGGELAGIGRDGIHQLANTTGDDLITIHLYAPPLMQLTVYSEDAPGTELRPLRYTLDEDLA
jgi:cysteine dioxygenase